MSNTFEPPVYEGVRPELEADGLTEMEVTEAIQDLTSCPTCNGEKEYDEGEGDNIRTVKCPECADVAKDGE